MLSKTKRVKHPNNAFGVSRILLIDFLDKFEFNIGIVSVKLLVSAYLQSYFSSTLLQVDTLNYLSESSSVNNFTDNVPVPNLLSYHSPVVTLEIAHLLKGLSPVTTNSVDIVKLQKFSLLKHCQFIHILLKSFWRS